MSTPGQTCPNCGHRIEDRYAEWCSACEVQRQLDAEAERLIEWQMWEDSHAD